MPLMRSGTLVTPFSGVPTLEDITYALAQMPRFAGQTTQPWTVLDHSVFAMLLASEIPFPELHLAALLHDAHEAMTGDIPSDMKTESMRSLQQKLDQRIMDRYFPGGHEAYANLHAQVATIDKRCLAAEAKVLGPPTETDEWREKVFGEASDLDIATLERVRNKPAHPEGTVQAINLLMDRCKR